MSPLPPLPGGGTLDSPSNIETTLPAAPPSPVYDDAPDALDAPTYPPYCLRSVRSNHVADLLKGLPPARFGLGRNYLETDPDNPIPWDITDAAWARSTHTPNHEEPKAARQALLEKYTPVLRPRSPTHRTDFPRPRPDGDPQPRNSRFLPRDDPNWTKAERSTFLLEAMIPQFPPNTKGVVETRRWTQAQPPEVLQGMQPELDAMVGAHALKIRRYEAFHIEWNEMQIQLRKKACELRAEYAKLYEDVGRLHHLFIRNRIGLPEYKPVREALIQQLDCTFRTMGMVANTTGALFAVGRAVAQGVFPPGGSARGKLDVATCDAVPYLKSVFPEFAWKKKPSDLPADPMAPEPYELPFEGDKPTYDFAKLMAVVWQNHPTKLQDIHKAVVECGFEGMKELTQRERDNVRALVLGEGEWTE